MLEFDVRVVNINSADCLHCGTKSLCVACYEPDSGTCRACRVHPVDSLRHGDPVLPWCCNGSSCSVVCFLIMSAPVRSSCDRSN